MTDLQHDTRTNPVTSDGDHEKFAHIVMPPSAVTESYIMGTPCTALCGKTWVPDKDPEKYPLCPTCVEVYSARFSAEGD